MSRRKAPPKLHAAYVVVASNEEGVQVGTTLIDKGNERHKVWEWMNIEKGSFTGATGQKVADLCAECRIDHHTIGLRGHEGEHGSAEVKEAARVKISDGVERWKTEQAELIESIKESTKTAIDKIVAEEEEERRGAV